MKKLKFKDAMWPVGRKPSWRQTENGFADPHYGSVEMVVAASDDGVAQYDRPAYIEAPGVIVVPWVRDGNHIKICLVKEEKPLATRIVGNASPIFWCFPGGFVDEGECMHATAVREAQEEAGISEVISLEQIGSINPNPTCFASWTTIFALETNTANVLPLRNVGGERIHRAEFFPLLAVFEYIRRGRHEGAELTGGTSLAALTHFLARYPDVLQ